MKAQIELIYIYDMNVYLVFPKLYDHMLSKSLTYQKKHTCPPN